MASAHARESRRVVAGLVLSELFRAFRQPFESWQDTSRQARTCGDCNAIEKVAPPDGSVHAQLFVLILICHEKPRSVRRFSTKNCKKDTKSANPTIRM